jgi:hypothetical protein
MKLSVLALALSCASTPRPIEAAEEECITKCGMVSEGGNCAELREVEAGGLAALERHLYGYTQPFMCEHLKGWKIEKHTVTKRDLLSSILCHSGSWWEPTNKRCVIGVTHSSQKLIELATLDWPESAIVHEMVHAIQGQTPGYYGGKTGHCKWTPEVKAALSEVMGGRGAWDEDCD